MKSIQETWIGLPLWQACPFLLILNEIHGNCCFDTTIAAGIQARALGPLLAACLGSFFRRLHLEFQRMGSI